MKMTIIVFLSIILLIFTTGCKRGNYKFEINSISNISENSIKLTDDFSFPIQKPLAQSFTQQGDTIYCKGIDETGFKAYQNILKADGWEIAYSSDVNFTYIKNNDTLNIIDQSFVTGVREIGITFKSGYSGSEREKALTKEEAIKLIQNYIDSSAKDSYIYGLSVKILVEYTVPDAFEKMRLQIFRVYGTGKSGTFLVCNNKVLDVFDGFENACVVDIDKDGKYELISLWGWGSGIYRIEIKAYKFGNPPNYNALHEVLYVAYSNCWIPDEGYAELRLKKLNDTDVELCSAKISNNGYEITKSFGNLKIDGSSLIPTSSKNFPFKTWDNVMKK